ncbi:hypothetical protein [Azospirillum picis]|uniref:Lipoprotein n=1 Tax=Azospirillum picis TaxID=488438 RepID=A0ABU0MMG2_9PROT|nr:hypothetical protein [Azospirillum picis]MBP2300946.1 hypothetical protein [Azospirillum picis]MDQ0534434.1 hypothetical protein [Azospirillum picis]
MAAATRAFFPGSRTLMAGCLAAALALPGCAGNNNDDVAGALLIGAAVVGLGVLAASGSDDDDHDSRRRRHDHRRYDDGYGGYGGGYRSGYGGGYGGRYAGNGRCDDARYRTSNGGRAAAGSDEWDCRRFGDGRK